MLKPSRPLLGDYVAIHAANRPEAAAIVTDEGMIGWKRFDLATRLVASGLLALARPGDRIGVVMGNCIAMAEIMLGAMRAGLVVVPLNPSVSDQTLSAMLEDAGVVVIAATPDHAPRLDGLPRDIQKILAGGTRAGWTAYEAWRDSRALIPLPAVAPSAPCNIIYSSGTTGTPKGIVHSHEGRLDWTYDLALALRYRDAPRTLITTGLYSNISWVGMLCSLLLGGTLFIHRAFDAGAVLRAIERDAITNMSMVPVQYQRLLDHPAFAATSTGSMIAMMCCGSPLPVDVKARLMASFSCGVIDLYGLTEGIATALNPEDAPQRLRSVGRPIQGTELRLLGAGDVPVGPGESGEIVGRSRFAMTEYWNNPTATAQAIWHDEDGREWLRSGDIGRFDEDGFLHIVDRKKDMILSGGQNIFPADIEAVLHQHPDIADCAVIGIPSESWGETPLALVVLRAGGGAAADPDEIRTWLNARLGRQQRVHRVEIRADLPRNANGKLLKTELRAPYWSDRQPGAGAH